MLNPKYAAPAVASPLQIDSLLVVPALYTFVTERAILDVLEAHSVEQRDRIRRVEALRDQAKQRPQQQSQQHRTAGGAWQVFLVNANDSHGNLHPISLGADARVGAIYAQLPAPFNDTRQWLVQIRCDGRLLAEMEQSVARAGITDGAVLQLSATRRVETAPCDSCGAVMALRELATHDCVALKQSGDGIPCEKCGALMPPELYTAHVARCK